MLDGPHFTKQHGWKRSSRVMGSMKRPEHYNNAGSTNGTTQYIRNDADDPTTISHNNTHLNSSLRWLLRTIKTITTMVRMWCSGFKMLMDLTTDFPHKHRIRMETVGSFRVMVPSRNHQRMMDRGWTVQGSNGCWWITQSTDGNGSSSRQSFHLHYANGSINIHDGPNFTNNTVDGTGSSGWWFHEIRFRPLLQRDGSTSSGSNDVDGPKFTNNTVMETVVPRVMNVYDTHIDHECVQDPMMLMDPTTISQATRDGNGSSFGWWLQAWTRSRLLSNDGLWDKWDASSDPMMLGDPTTLSISNKW
jgi:hypothetical protein